MSNETLYYSKYEQGLDITEIAKRLRKEIREAVKAGELPKCKYHVRIARYSMGQSLSVSISETPFPINNRRYLELEHAVSERVLDQGWCEANRRDERDETDRWTKEALDLYPKMEAMANQWNYDGSDSQTDYYHVNYSMSVDYDAHDEWVKMTEEIKHDQTNDKRESPREVEQQMLISEVQPRSADTRHFPRLARLED